MRRSQRTPKKPLKFVDSEAAGKSAQSLQKAETQKPRPELIPEPCRIGTRSKARGSGHDKEPETRGTKPDQRPKSASQKKTEHSKEASGLKASGGRKSDPQIQDSESETPCDTKADIGRKGGRHEGAQAVDMKAVETRQCSTQTPAPASTHAATQTDLTTTGDLMPVQQLQPHTEVYVPVVSDTGVKALRRVQLMESGGSVYLADLAPRPSAPPEASNHNPSTQLKQNDKQMESGVNTSETAVEKSPETEVRGDGDHCDEASDEADTKMEVDSTMDSKDSVMEENGRDLGILNEDKINIKDEFSGKTTTLKDLDKPVECPDCHRRFMTLKSMKNHQKIRCRKRETGDRPFVCETCGKGCITKDDLRKHKLTHDKIRGEVLSSSEEEEKDDDVTEGAGSHVCETCGKRLSSEERLQKHVRRHMQEKPYTCTQCSKTFKHKTAFQNHMKRHENGEADTACDVCGKQCANARCLKAHKALHQGECPYQCGVCGKGAGSLSNMKKHMLVHTQDRPYTCSYCGKAFQRKPALKEHERIHTGEKPFQCTVCGKAFTLNNTLKMHMMRHRGERPFKCDICGKGFLNNFILKDHYRTHTGEKPYPCPICHKFFTTRANLGAHVKLHSGQRPFSCSHCGKAFTSKAKMKMHEDSHKGKIQHYCPVCKKGFVRKDSLFSHLRVHRADKTPSLCSMCGNKYSSPAALRVHFKKHLDIKPFECSICGKAFTRSDVWKKHLEWHMKHLDDIPGGQLEILEIGPDQEDVQIVVEDGVHLVVDQQNEDGKVEYVEIPISELGHDGNAAIALAQHEGQTEVIITEIHQDAEVVLAEQG